MSKSATPNTKQNVLDEACKLTFGRNVPIEEVDQLTDDQIEQVVSTLGGFLVGRGMEGSHVNAFGQLIEDLIDQITREHAGEDSKAE